MHMLIKKKSLEISRIAAIIKYFKRSQTIQKYA